jgi:hypothetical protein
MIRAADVKRIILPHLPYAGLFWLFTKVGEAYRVTPGKDVLHKLLGAILLALRTSNPVAITCKKSKPPTAMFSILRVSRCNFAPARLQA